MAQEEKVVAAGGATPTLPLRRGRKFTKKGVEAALRASGGFVSTTAKKLGCTEKTVRNYIRRYPDLETVLWEVREQHIDLAEASLIAQVQEKNTAATIFLLKCLGKKRGYIENPAIQLHAHAEMGQGTWIDIMKRAVQSGELADSSKVIDITPHGNSNGKKEA